MFHSWPKAAKLRCNALLLASPKWRWPEQAQPSSTLNVSTVKSGNASTWNLSFTTLSGSKKTWDQIAVETTLDKSNIGTRKNGGWETTFLLESSTYSTWSSSADTTSFVGVFKLMQPRLVFVARKDENWKDVCQLHQSAKIPHPPPTSALELVTYGFGRRHNRAPPFHFIHFISPYFGD